MGEIQGLPVIGQFIRDLSEEGRIFVQRLWDNRVKNAMARNHFSPEERRIYDQLRTIAADKRTEFRVVLGTAYTYVCGIIAQKGEVNKERRGFSSQEPDHV